MTIKIDQRSDDSAYIEVGDITVYVELTTSGTEFVHVWKNTKEDLFKNDAWVSFMGFRNNSCLLCRRPALLYLANK